VAGAVAPLPVFAWELTLAIFLIAKGPRTTQAEAVAGRRADMLVT